MRRNFVHNCVVHPICGLIWLVADTIGACGMTDAKGRLVALGERIHADGRWAP